MKPTRGICSKTPYIRNTRLQETETNRKNRVAATNQPLIYYRI